MAATRLLPTRAVALAFLLTATAAPAKEPADIPVVKTWGELMDVEPLVVNGHKVRLGIEADTFGVTGGVLLYCLPGALGARSRDRVRMQLLHSPVRARPVGGQLLHAHQALGQQRDEDYVSRMSNTIEFVAPRASGKPPVR